MYPKKSAVRFSQRYLLLKATTVGHILLVYGINKNFDIIVRAGMKGITEYLRFSTKIPCK